MSESRQFGLNDDDLTAEEHAQYVRGLTEGREQVLAIVRSLLAVEPAYPDDHPYTTVWRGALNSVLQEAKRVSP